MAIFYYEVSLSISKLASLLNNSAETEANFLWISREFANFFATN